MRLLHTMLRVGNLERSLFLSKCIEHATVAPP